jgi:hypothetical protein
MKQIFALINIRRDKKIRSDSASVWNSWIYGWVMGDGGEKRRRVALGKKKAM